MSVKLIRLTIYVFVVNTKNSVSRERKKKKTNDQLNPRER
jgi:hypothetical protein